MKYPINILNHYIEKGLVIKQDHPSLPLSIYNYSRTCQYDGLWDDVTTACRGLILDNEGNVVASAFPKFFNYEEVADKVPVKGDYVYVQEKVDGSLGILFYYNNEWHLATKGSFTSDQAKKGMEIIKSKYNLRTFITHVAYIVEIIYPENRIVVDYGNKEKVVFLSVTSEGEELHWTTAQAIFHASGIDKKDIVKTEQHFAFGPELYNALKSKNEANKEGFILRFQPGNFRMKIKFEEYVRLHRIITNFSSKDIWELMMNGESLEPFLERVPDEFDNWVKMMMLKFIVQYQTIEDICKADFETYKSQFDNKKDFAMVVQHHMYSSILFSMWDNKKYDHIIWRLIKPEYEKPFWSKEEA